MGKKEKTLLVITTLALILIVGTLTYAFFSAGVSNENKQEVSITTGDMKLTFEDGTNGFTSALNLGESATKSFIICNEGSLNAYATMYWLDLTNDYMEGSLTYTLNYDDEETGSIIMTKQNVPRSAEPSKFLLYDNIGIPAKECKLFNLTITLNNLDINQNDDIDAVMNTKFTLEAKHSPSQQTLAALGLTANTKTPDFSKIATTDEGIFAADDDYGTSYYFRGNVTNNYVKFGVWNEYYYYDEEKGTEIGFPTWAECNEAATAVYGEEDDYCDYIELEEFTGNYGEAMYWRIIRINGDGSLRLIYDGTSKHANSDADEDRLLVSPGYASFNDEYYDYNYSNESVNGHTKRFYTLNLHRISEYIADSFFCNDTSEGEQDPIPEFGSKTRLSNKTPSLKCPNKDDVLNVLNGKLKYPIGLITADEAAFAGGVYTTINDSYYLFKGKNYWTMSPSDEDDYSILTINNEGAIDYFAEDWDTGEALPGVVPVINLTAEYARTLKLDSNGVYVAE